MRIGAAVHSPLVPLPSSLHSNLLLFLLRRLLLACLLLAGLLLRGLFGRGLLSGLLLAEAASLAFRRGFGQHLLALLQREVGRFDVLRHAGIALAVGHERSIATL